MSCQTYKLGDIGRECLDNMGGIKVVYAIPHELISIAVNDAKDSSGQITGTGEITAITTASTYTTANTAVWEFRKETASMTSTFNVDDAAGTASVSTELSLIFNKQSAQKRLQILAACLGEVCLFVTDNNGKIWFLGEDNYVSASAAGSESGTAAADRNAYTVTLTDISKTFPREVNQTACYDTLVAIRVKPTIAEP